MWSETFVVALKTLAGRTLPQTGLPGVPSLLGDGTYGFFPLHGGLGWTSFPSGHVAATAAIAGVFWQLDRRYRPAMVAIILLAACDTVLHNAHFFSDALAGVAIGFSCGLATTALWRSHFKGA